MKVWIVAQHIYAEFKVVACFKDPVDALEFAKLMMEDDKERRILIWEAEEFQLDE